MLKIGDEVFISKAMFSDFPGVDISRIKEMDLKFTITDIKNDGFVVLKSKVRGKWIEYEEQMANEEDIQYAKKQRRYLKLKKVHGKPHAK